MAKGFEWQVRRFKSLSGATRAITIDLPRYRDPDRDLQTAIAVLDHILTRLRASQAVRESDRLAEFFSDCPIPDWGRLDIRELRKIESIYGEQHRDL